MDMVNRITAGQAQALAKKEGALLSIADQKKAEEVLNVIYAKIKESIEWHPARHNIKFTWDWYIWNPGKVKNPIQNHFPTLEKGEGLYVWDGGEGRSDHPSKIGAIVHNQLKADGYEVTLYNGNLEVRW